MRWISSASATGWSSCQMVFAWQESRNVSRATVIRPDTWKGLEWDAGKAMCQLELELGWSKMGCMGWATEGAAASHFQMGVSLTGRRTGRLL